MQYDPPRLLPVGDSALLIEFGDEIDLAINERVHNLASALGELSAPGLGEAVPAYRSLLWHYDPGQLSWPEVEDLAREALEQVESHQPRQPRVVIIPTCYGGQYGPDLEALAHQNGLTPAEVIHLHSSSVYSVFMLGFSPGFAYMGGLPRSLWTPRLATPRTKVPAGSVGMAGGQTGIYPISTPGGWQIIGRTFLRLFVAQRDPPSLLRPADRVQFSPIDSDKFAALQSREWETRDPQHGAGTPTGFGVPEAPAPAGLEVLRPGLSTTVQDLGRRGYERFGVTAAGAMDPFALIVANALVRNSTAAAGLEITGAGLALKATADCLIAVAGADLGLSVNGQPIPCWLSAFVRRGWPVQFSGRRSGCRAYLAVAGGISVPLVMGSLSTYLRGGFGGLGGRALQPGDFLPVGPTQADLATLAGRRFPVQHLPAYGDHPTLQVILGPQDDAFTAEGLRSLLDGQFLVTTTADRMGYRLQGSEIAHRDSADIVSDGIVMGALQVPSDRQPIVMMADRQTTGGYAKLVTVVSADLPLLAQCTPGLSAVRFRETSVGEAQLRYRRMQTCISRVTSDVNR